MSILQRGMTKHIFHQDEQQNTCIFRQQEQRNKCRSGQVQCAARRGAVCRVNFVIRIGEIGAVC